MFNELTSRIAGRKWGNDLVRLWVEETEPRFNDGSLADPDAYINGIARAFREWSDSILGQPFSESKVMTKAEAERYESNCIRFGKYLGTPIKDIPLDYLQWLADAQNELCAYLRSEVGRKRQEVEQP
jgi:hypothetical protein